MWTSSTKRMCLTISARSLSGTTGWRPARGEQHLVGDDARDEVVAAAAGVLEDVEVPDVEQVEGAAGVADAAAEGSCGGEVERGHQYAPSARSTTRMVRQMSMRSPVSDQFST